ncbi:MAG: hypothetical protein JRE23_18005 [Deltaproteobacteria bacterium]|nr:hypothetical protein [Deltaproteobacteria bacterium]
MPDKKKSLDALLVDLKAHRESMKTMPIEELILVGIPGYNPLDDCEGFFFCKELAERAIDFIEECCTHVKGKWAGKPFLLQPWQKAIVGNLFGWIAGDIERSSAMSREKTANLCLPLR